MNIKAIFFDIDGTLMSFKTNKIPKSTEESIKKLQKKGIKVIVATGRSINSLDHIKHINFDGFITFNGGYCETIDRNILFKQYIEAEDIKSLIKYSENAPLRFSLMYENKVEINDITPEVVAMYAHLNLPIPPLQNKNNVDIDHVLQANIFLSPHDEANFMKNEMPNSIATRWSPVFIDVNPGAISKRNGVEIFCKHFGIDSSETMAFGDGGNDISMLKLVKIGVAMGNANENVKECADFVTEDVDKNGIELALKHFNVL